MPITADEGSQPVDLAREPDFLLGKVKVCPSSREVVGAQREVVEPRVMQVLVALARRRGQVVSRDQLIETCWAGRVVGEDAINRCIAKVRRLGETHGAFSLETIARVGHRLTEQAGEQPAPGESVAPTVENLAPAAEKVAAKRPRWVATVAIVGVVLAVAAAIGIAQMRARERAREAEVLSRVTAYVDNDQYGAAFALAAPLSRDERARANPAFEELWRKIVVPIKPLVAQEGASVSFKAYDDPEGAWIAAGVTPIKNWVEAPRGALRLKIEKAGFRTAEFVVAVPGPSVQTEEPRKFPFDRPSVPLELVAENKLPNDMVYVPRTDVPVYLSGWSSNLLGSDRHDIAAFAIARTEVTNREFKEFIDAGGYDDEQYWRDLKFVYRAQTLTWTEARKLLVDSTGRPGPAEWQLSAYRRGEDDLPVVGISWYEAVAYARFRKQMLPTIHHWMRAAFTPYDPMFPTAAAITKQSRFFADGPESARSAHGLGPWGTYHMAGNAREWVWNFAGGDAVALGSGWPEYASNFARVYTADPMARLPDHGFRLMSTLDAAPIEPALLQPIKLVRDTAFANRAPVSDDAFAAMRFQFTTPRAAPTDVKVKRVDESALWTADEVALTFAAQGPTTIFIVRPKAHQGPLQPIVYSGVGDCCYTKRPNRDVLEQLQIAGFVVNSGRALVMPIWAGGYERYELEKRETAEAMDRERLVSLAWQHDLATTIDYLETLADMDTKHIGYFGVSRGASFAGAINLALEPRISAAVLAAGGIWIHSSLHPMIDLINYAPRVTIPVLMLSGRYDHIYPYEQSQKRTFELLGTPAGRKQQIAYDTGHFTLPPNRVAADVTDWFDRYLGRSRT